MQTVTIENITAIVIDSMAEETDPRLRQVLSSLIRHMHDFAREVSLTHDEWMRGIEFLTHAAKMTDGKRNEFILIADILGLESLVDAISHDAQNDETESAVLGPFFREGAPVLPAGASISQRGAADGPPVLVRGTVRDF